MKIKIFNFLSIIYNVLKTDYWPYRYYILLYILFIIIFTMNMITYIRIMRFLVTLIIIIIYKYLYLYIIINEYNIKIFNVKFLIILMYYNIIINPVLYIVWNAYKYITKIKKVIKTTIKNQKLAIILISCVINLTTPIRYVHMRYYKMLYNFHVYTIFEIFFIRIYGLIISVLIFSDIINYLLNLTGSFLYLMIYIYLIIYIINVVYTSYIWFKIYLGLEFKYLKKLLNVKIIKCLEKMYIYKILLNYFKNMISENITIRDVFYNRIDLTLTGSIIRKILTSKIEDFEIYIYKIPSMWRYYIYNLPLTNLKFVYGNSYIDYQTSKFIHCNVNNICNELYIDLFYDISNIFVLLESVMYFKYFNVNNAVIKTSEYEYAYKLYYLILKNILHFMWSVEYHINKNQITRLYVDKQIGEYGYSIYFNEKCNDHTELPLYTKKDFTDNKLLNNEKYDCIYESIHLLINLSEKDWMYVGYKENVGLKNLNNVHLKYRQIFDTGNLVDVYTIYEKEQEKNYLIELNNLMQEIKKDWERLGPLDIFEKRTVFLELINHLKKNGFYWI